MKKHFKILIVIALLGIVFFLLFSKLGLFCSDKRFAYPNADKITKIEIKKDSLLSIIEKTNGQWLINGEHLANTDMIEDVLTIISKLEVEYPLPKIYGETITDSFIMASGINIKVFTGKSLKRNYYLYSQEDLNCVGLLKGRKQAYNLYMPGYPVNPYNYLSANPSFWLNNLAFSYSTDEIVSIELENMSQPEESFKIEQVEKNKFKISDTYNLTNPNNADTVLIKRYFSYFASVTFDKYPELSEEEKRDILMSDYGYKLTIETKEGKNDYKIIYIPVNDELDAYGNPLAYNRQHFYLAINSKQNIVIASWLNFNILLKNLSDFVNK